MSGAPGSAGAATRLAFVGDSFTEALQVPERQTLCAQIEDHLRGSLTSAAENFGVSGAGPFEFYHRLRHDVLATRPTAVVLCLYPGHDFTDPCPPSGFTADGTLKPEYSSPYNLLETTLAWLISHSKACYGLYRGLVFIGRRLRGSSPLAKTDWWMQVPQAPGTVTDPEAQRRFSVLRQIEARCREARAGWWSS